jgi:hypothetical protein
MVTDSNGCSSLSLSYSFTVGLPQIDGIKDGVIVYPNPIAKNGTITVELLNLKKGRNAILITDIAGRVACRKLIEISSDHQVLSIDLTGISPGLYFLSPEINLRKTATKLVIE